MVRGNTRKDYFHIGLLCLSILRKVRYHLLAHRKTLRIIDVAIESPLIWQIHLAREDLVAITILFVSTNER